MFSDVMHLQLSLPYLLVSHADQTKAKKKKALKTLG
jgi:hypothetical protein